MSELHPIEWRIEEITRMVRLASDLIEQQQTELRRLERQVDNFQQGYFNACHTMAVRKDLLALCQRWMQHATTCPGYGMQLWDVTPDMCNCGLDAHFAAMRGHL